MQATKATFFAWPAHSSLCWTLRILGISAVWYNKPFPDVLERHRLGAAPFVADLGGFLTVARRA